MEPFANPFVPLVTVAGFFVVKGESLKRSHFVLSHGWCVIPELSSWSETGSISIGPLTTLLLIFGKILPDIIPIEHTKGQQNKTFSKTHPLVANEKGFQKKNILKSFYIHLTSSIWNISSNS